MSYAVFARKQEAAPVRTAKAGERHNGAKPLQRKAAAPGRSGETPQVVHEVLNSPGRPLEAANRAFFEQRFGHDFSKVRIHADDTARESARSVNALAYTVGNHIVFADDRRHAADAAPPTSLLAHELAHVVQQTKLSGAGAPGAETESEADVAGRAAAMGQRAAVRTPAETSIQRQEPQKKETSPKLLEDFGAKFPDAAKLVKASAAAMTLVNEADAAGTSFGGFAEDGPSKEVGRAYTVGTKVYVPKGRGAVQAMRDFLFELNNAVRSPKFSKLAGEATKAKKTDAAAAKKYARDITEQEVEGMLRLGQVWFETKKAMKKVPEDWSQYDNDFFLSEYQSFKDKKKTKDDIIKDVLARKYETGTLKGKTVEQHYMEQFKEYAGD